MIIEGKPLFDLAPDFAEAPEPGAQRLMTAANLSVAPRIAAPLGAHPVHTLRHRFVLVDAEIATFEDFFYTQAGRWGDFWVPSWHAELNPTAGLAIGGAALTITPVEYASVYDPTHPQVNRLGHYIYLHDQDGSMHVSKVTGVTGAEILTLATPAERTWTLGRFYAGFLYRVRFLSDNLELEYSGPNVARATVAFQEVVISESTADV